MGVSASSGYFVCVCDCLSEAQRTSHWLPVGLMRLPCCLLVNDLQSYSINAPQCAPRTCFADTRGPPPLPLRATNLPPCAAPYFESSPASAACGSSCWDQPPPGAAWECTDKCCGRYKIQKACVCEQAAGT